MEISIHFDMILLPYITYELFESYGKFMMMTTIESWTTIDEKISPISIGEILAFYQNFQQVLSCRRNKDLFSLSFEYYLVKSNDDLRLS